MHPLTGLTDHQLLSLDWRYAVVAAPSENPWRELPWWVGAWSLPHPLVVSEVRPMSMALVMSPQSVLLKSHVSQKYDRTRILAYFRNVPSNFGQFIFKIMNRWGEEFGSINTYKSRITKNRHGWTFMKNLNAHAAPSPDITFPMLDPETGFGGSR